MHACVRPIILTQPVSLRTAGNCRGIHDNDNYIIYSEVYLHLGYVYIFVNVSVCVCVHYVYLLICFSQDADMPTSYFETATHT